MCVFQGHLTRTGKLFFFMLNALLFTKDLYVEELYENRMKWKSLCIVPRSRKNGEQSENYFSKSKSLKRTRIPMKEYLPAFKGKMPFFFFPH